RRRLDGPGPPPVRRTAPSAGCRRASRPHAEAGARRAAFWSDGVRRARTRTRVGGSNRCLLKASVVSAMAVLLLRERDDGGPVGFSARRAPSPHSLSTATCRQPTVPSPPIAQLTYAAFITPEAPCPTLGRPLLSALRRRNLRLRPPLGRVLLQFKTLPQTSVARRAEV